VSSKRTGPRTRHDALVRHVLCRPKAAAIELRHVLPAEVVAELELDSLALDSPSYARPSRGPLDSDLLFTVKLRDDPGDPEPCSIYLSIDHQSRLDDLFPWRAHVYAGAVWGRFIDSHAPPRPRMLPFILPVLLTQHPARDTPTRLSDIIQLPARVRDTFGAPFQAQVYVDDLSGSVLDDPVADPGHIALVEITRALLHAYKCPGSLSEARLATLGPLFDTVLDHFGSCEVEELLSYVFHVFGEGSPIFAIIMDTLGKAVKEVYVTMADKLRAEGRVEGRAEGRVAAKAEAVLVLLGHRTGPVPQPVRDRVLATAEEPLLQRWFDRALTAASLEEVFQPLDA
jgi:predicted transposase YdaD